MAGPRVGHARHRSHAAGQGGAGAGGDRLVLFVARLAQMDMNVDQSRTNDHALGVDDDLGLFVAPSHRQNPAAADPEIANLVDVLRGVDDPAAGDLNGPQRKSPSRGTPSGHALLRRERSQFLRSRAADALRSSIRPQSR